MEIVLIYISQENNAIDGLVIGFPHVAGSKEIKVAEGHLGTFSFLTQSTSSFHFHGNLFSFRGNL